MDAPMPPEVKTAWERFAYLDGNRKPGQNLYMDIFKDGWLYPLQRTRETEKMIAFARTIAPRVVMEIGTDKGGGFYHWVKGLEPAKAIAVEFRGCPFAGIFPAMLPKTQMKFIEGSSYDPGTVQSVMEFLNGDLIDVLFIDGDKNGTEQDFKAYLRFIRPGGLVMIHDVVDKHIHPSQFFFNLRGYEKDIIFDGTEGLEAAARGEAGLPIDSAYEQWLRIWKDTSCGVGIIRC
jgi:predicted O-methyltransferase YrrM